MNRDRSRSPRDQRGGKGGGRGPGAVAPRPPIAQAELEEEDEEAPWWEVANESVEGARQAVARARERIEAAEAFNLPEGGRGIKNQCSDYRSEVI